MLSIALRLVVGVAVFAAVSVIAVGARARQAKSPPTPSPGAPLSGSTAPGQSPLPVASSPETPVESTAPPVAPAEGLPEPRPAAVPSTTHGRLVMDGYFAQRIGLIAALGRVPLAGKSVSHLPNDYLISALVNVLAGHDQLQQISRGENPLRSDLLLAKAWGQEQFPEASGTCRQLHALGWEQAEAVRDELRRVFAPYVALSVGPVMARRERIQVDWDLTAKEISTDAKSDPFAAYGHMESETELGRGYQWAETVVRGVGPGGQPRPVSLGGFLRPGNTHPLACVERLQAINESTLDRPRRRPDLLLAHVAAARSLEDERQGRVNVLQALVDRQRTVVAGLRAQAAAIEQRLAGHSPTQNAARARDEASLGKGRARLAKAEEALAGKQQRLAAGERALAEAWQRTETLRARLPKLQAENAALDAANQRGGRIEVIMDCQFGDSSNVASLLEAGYDLTTKARSAATMTKLLGREAAGERIFGEWKAVSANAEVAECLVAHYAECPHSLRLLGYRKALAASGTKPARTSYALFLTSIPATERSSEEVVHQYHLRGGVPELLNRESKSHLGGRGLRLRSGPGLDVLGQFIFAALNFVPWLTDTVWADSGPEAGKRTGFAGLTHLARAPAQVLADEEGLVVQFTNHYGNPERTLTLQALRQPPLPGFAWPGVPNDAHLPLPN